MYKLQLPLRLTIHEIESFSSMRINVTAGKNRKGAPAAASIVQYITKVGFDNSSS
ncbi:hypothetical protein Plhal304r1_c045g0125621 [Plasmopara halstedii]